MQMTEDKLYHFNDITACVMKHIKVKYEHYKVLMRQLVYDCCALVKYWHDAQFSVGEHSVVFTYLILLSCSDDRCNACFLTVHVVCRS